MTIVVISPTHRSVVCAQSAGMISADAYGCEGCIRRRRAQTVVIKPIACHCAVCAQSAEIMIADAHGCEGFTCRRRECSYIMRPQICYIPPEHRNAIRSQYGGIIPPAGCYGGKSIRDGACGFASDGSGGRTHMEGSGSGGRSLLRARAVRVRQQDE